ncbi:MULTISPECIES: diacylglycerol/lipid kinase family protein [unclassified Pseudoalteromonas]|uniref:diacylglycerol/lipid kinase family protein n=1 Tax=unclassified Pseudoalteromonas TaxID=194690 RepID=UPI0030148129
MLVVVNPLAGPAAAQHIAWLEQQIKRKKCSVKWLYSSGNYASDCSIVAKLATTEDTVVVIGGDGTLNLVINAVANLACDIALLPAGTGNDFARQFQYSTEQWRNSVFSSHTMAIDLGRVNQHWFVNIAGVGFNAHVVSKLQQGKRLGRLSYTLAGLTALWSAKTMRLEHSDWPQQGMMLLAANGKHFAAGLTPAPMASIADGQLELIWFTPRTMWQRVGLFAAMLLGRHMKVTNVYHQPMRHFEVSEPGLPVEADGEIVATTPVEIRCYAGQIRIKKAPSINGA